MLTSEVSEEETPVPLTATIESYLTHVKINQKLISRVEDSTLRPLYCCPAFKLENLATAGFQDLSGAAIFPEIYDGCTFVR